MSLAWRPLGKTGIDVPLLGYGVAGPLGSNVVSDDEAAALIRAAYDGGARLFDTSPSYGRAEERLGAALNGLSRGMYRLVTKAGTRWRMGMAEKDFSPDGVRRSLEESLRRLNTDYVDVLLLHGPTTQPFNAAMAQAAAKWKAEGLIRAIGVSSRGDEIIFAIKLGFGDVVQAPVFGRASDGRLWADITNNLGVGFLGIEALRDAAGGMRPLRSAADLFHVARAFRQGRIGPARDVEASLRAALALPVSSVIIGAARQDHLAANLAVARELS